MPTHIPVLRERCVELLGGNLRDGGVYVDATLGLAGHASAVLSAYPQAFLVGIDRDTQALSVARERLLAAGHEGRFHLVHATYDEIPRALAEAGFSAADGILMDLGLSSLQIDDDTRGFAYRVDAPLDMRMDQESDTPTAADLLAELDESELAHIISEYGEERFARKIARRIVVQRETQPLTRSSQLVELLDRAIPAASKRSGGHPAKRTFQALRIAVNREFEILDRALNCALDSLEVGGRLVIESYHSLEDRRVKQAFASRTRSSAPAGLPLELEEHKPTFRTLTRGAEQADETEQETNPRSASVRLRAVERIRADRRRN
ncbi:16S rRNA (cytosine(1402)-N(4))-methyltransferase RsmH [Dermabacteraceae bacterium P7074]